MKKLVPEIYKKYYAEGKDNIETFCKVFVSPSPDNLVSPTKAQKDFIDKANSGKYKELWMAGGNSGGKTFALKFLATQWAVYKIKPGKSYKNIDDYRRSEYNILCTGPEQKQAMELGKKLRTLLDNLHFYDIKLNQSLLVLGEIPIQLFT